MDIDAMPAGRTMDELVAERVMGYECDCEGGTKSDCPIHGRQPRSLNRYSTDIFDAWQVVQEIGLIVGKEIISIPDSKWVARNSWADIGIRAVAETAPLAICRAALKIANEHRQTAA